jgi:hypothetical protein
MTTDTIVTNHGTQSEPAGDGIARVPEALRSTQQYVRNVAVWLSA